MEVMQRHWGEMWAFSITNQVENQISRREQCIRSVDMSNGLLGSTCPMNYRVQYIISCVQLCHVVTKVEVATSHRGNAEKALKCAWISQGAYLIDR
jgi:hypothetical protein